MNHPDPGPEDVETDSQSDHSVSEDSDAPASNLDPDENENENEDEHEDEHRNSTEQEDEHPNPNEQEDEGELYEDVDVTGLEIEGLSTDPNKNDWNFEKWTEHLTKFVRSPFGPEGFLGRGWHGVKPLGRGGFAMAALWERKNEDNDTVDRMVIKQIGRRKTRKGSLAGTFLAWESGYPIEVDLMRAMKNKNNIVQIRGYRRYPEKEVHRIYMEYCSLGDLADLITQYRSRRQFMPEAFICHVFLHLARACQSLTEPISPKNDPDKYKDPDKNEIVHRDIKPRNVFVGDLDNGQDKTGIPYPEVKLGDFGGAIFTGIDDASNPWEYRAHGTEGYKPLEMENFDQIGLYERFGAWPHIERAETRFKHYDDNTQGGGLRRFPLMMLSKTNIWGVGAVMFDLMTLKPVKNYLWQTRDANDPDWDDEEPEEPNVKTGIYNTPYPRRLQDIVRWCLADLPDRRPTVAQLISDLESFVAERREEEWQKKGTENELTQSIPWQDFTAMPTGEWQSSENQSKYKLPDSSFAHTEGEHGRWKANKPERDKRLKALQEERNEKRRIRREKGEKDVEDDEFSLPNTGERKRRRAEVRAGKGDGQGGSGG
ncbi:MAG: hypothetical protein Q9226_007905 [Calogaya cf. arnoldii]